MFQNPLQFKKSQNIGHLVQESKFFYPSMLLEHSIKNKLAHFGHILANIIIRQRGQLQPNTFTLSVFYKQDKILKK